MTEAPLVRELGRALRIAPATPGDAPALHAIAAGELPEIGSLAALAEALAAPATRAWRADTDGTTCGFLVAAVVTDEFHVHAVCVARAARRRGVGTALLGTALRAAGDAGMTSALLELRADNAAARALYARHGFREVGRRACYYRDGTDALLLTRASLAEDPETP